VRAEAAKFTAGIMGRNWLHVKDGTGGKGSSDLTVTTQGSAAVGDRVVVHGRVAVQRDYGAGYVYPVIIEDAQIRPGKPADGK
jgi:hypothetical protein